MQKHVLMDQTLRNMRGHRRDFDNSCVKDKKTLEAWHTSAPSMLTIYFKKIPNQCSILFKNESREKRIYILIIKVDKLFSFFLSRCLLKLIENMSSAFLSRYRRNTRESLGELEEAVETLACG